MNGWDRQAYFELKSLGDSAKLPVRTPSGIFKGIYNKYIASLIIYCFNNNNYKYYFRPGRNKTIRLQEVQIHLGCGQQGVLFVNWN